MRLILPFLGLLFSIGINANSISSKALNCVGPVLYVDTNVSEGAQDGSSWTDALHTIDEALALAAANEIVEEIWVAEGIYYVSADNDREDALDMLSGVNMYGSFEGTEASIESRSIEDHPTIISGDLGTEEIETDNSKNLFHFTNINEIEVDGFVFKNAFNNEPAPFGLGGALCILNSATDLVSSIKIVNCTFESNRTYQGAAAYILGGNSTESTIDFEKCTFQNNTASGTGGAIYQAKSTGASILTSMSQTLFKNNNSATGGAIYVGGDGGATTEPLEFNLALYNCIFDKNIANNGGAIYMTDASSASTLLSQNCTFYENTGTTIYFGSNVNAEIKNSILWGEGTQLDFFFATGEVFDVDNSIVSGGYVGANNMDVDPEFGNAESGNFRISACSPALDAGINFANPPIDFSGADRNYNSTMDIGAYEFNGKFINLPLKGENQSQALSTSEITDADGWTHFYNCDTKTFQGSIFKNGQDLGALNSANFQLFTTARESINGQAQNLSDADYLGNEQEEWFAMNSAWTINSTATLTAPVRLRFYFEQSELAALRESLGTDFELSEMEFYKISGAGLDAYSTDVMDRGGAIITYTNAEEASLNTWKLGTQDDMLYAEFELNGFSSGTGGIKKSSVLPVELADFYAEAVGNKRVDIKWETLTEKNNDYFILEKSNDAATFKSVATILGNGDSESSIQYSFTDLTPFRGANYYRLRQVDYDGQMTLSSTAIAYIKNESEKLLLFPNPALDVLFVQVPETVDGEVLFTIFDTNGKAIKSIQRISTAQAVHDLPLDDLQAGIYTLKIRSRYHRELQRFVISEK